MGDTRRRRIHLKDGVEASQHGTIYRTAPAGTFSSVYNFDGTSGGSPMITLLQHTTGILYGDTYTRGTHNTGTFYSLKASLGTYAALLPTSGKVGKAIGILGQGFNGAKGVSFNGTAAKFNISSDTFLTATIPAGATTGIMMVAIPNGNLKSKLPRDSGNQDFHSPRADQWEHR